MTSPVTPDEPESGAKPVLIEAKLAGEARSEDREAAPDALDVPRLADALRATGALWSANDYYEATTDADEFAAAIAREYRAEAGRAATVSASVEPTAARSERGNREEPDLSTAWAGAESALPEGSDDEDGDWLLTLTRTDDGETRGRYVATAGPYFGSERDDIAAFGPTPAAALQALTARLQARSTEQGGAG